jgi:hypothetical protein
MVSDHHCLNLLSIIHANNNNSKIMRLLPVVLTQCVKVLLNVFDSVTIIRQTRTEIDHVRTVHSGLSPNHSIE